MFNDRESILGWRDLLAMPFVAFVGGVYIMAKTILILAWLTGLVLLFVQGCSLVVWTGAWLIAAAFGIEGVPLRETPWLWEGGGNNG